MVLTLAKMLAMKVIKIEEGAISVYGRPMVLIPAETLILFHETLESKVGEEEADRTMFEIGEALTIESTRRYIRKKDELRPVFKKTTTGDPAIEMGREVFRMSGMGDTKIIEVTKNSDKFVVETRNSPVALEYLRSHGKSSKPVCSFLRGMMSGVLCGSGQSGYTSRESKCKAMGVSGECAFEFVRNEKRG